MTVSKRELVVVGAGPAGLAASIEAAKAGVDVLLIDENFKAGGQLFKQIHKFFGSKAHRAGTRGIDIGKELLQEAEDLGVEVWLNSLVIGCYKEGKLAVEVGTDIDDKTIRTVEAENIVLACGASENAVRFDGWTMPGVMGAGAAQTMINVNSVLPGEKILMIGSGNVGLIVSYQLMQAGAEVVGLVEAAPKIGGYVVHAGKITRAGVPILTNHTVKKAVGKDRVEGAIIVELDDKFQEVPGTEQFVEVDTICIATGLKPFAKLAMMADTEIHFDPVQGGWVPLHDEGMATSTPGIFVAGDISAVEEANTALEEGKLAGISAAERLGKISKEEADRLRDETWDRLNGLRYGPHGEARKQAKDRQIQEFHELVENNESQKEVAQHAN